MNDQATYPVRAVTVEAVVSAAPDVVFAYVADTRNDPEWCPNVGQVTQTEGERVEVGARFQFSQTVEAQGKQLVSDVEVEIVSIEGRVITWRVEDKFQSREISLAVVPHPDGSKVVQRTEASFKRKPSVVMKWVYPVLAKRTFRDQFKNLAEQFSG